MSLTIFARAAAVTPLSSSAQWWDKNWLSLAILAIVLVVILLVALFAYLKMRSSWLAEPTPPGDGQTRSTLARNVVIVAITGIVLLAFAVLISSASNNS